MPEFQAANVDQLLQQAPALVGVVLGALASYLTAFASERSKWRREQRLRRSEKQSAVYAEYGSAVKDVYQWTMHFGHCRGLPAFGPDISAQAAEAEMSRVNHARAVKWETVLLLGSEATIAAARKWHESIWQMQSAAAASSPEVAGWMAARAASNVARSDYYACARRDLGVSESGLI